MSNLDLSRIKPLALRRGISLSAIAREVGITPTGLSRIMRENSSRANTLQSICDILGCRVNDLYDDMPLPTVEFIGKKKRYKHPPITDYNDMAAPDPIAEPNDVPAQGLELTLAIQTLRDQLTAKDAQIMELIRALNK